MKSWTGALLVAAALVGAPTVVFLVARSEQGARHPSAAAAAATTMAGTLERESYFHIQCGWTGYANGGQVTITCSGRREDGSGASVKILTRAVNSGLAG